MTLGGKHILPHDAQRNPKVLPVTGGSMATHMAITHRGIAGRTPLPIPKQAAAPAGSPWQLSRIGSSAHVHAHSFDPGLTPALSCVPFFAAAARYSQGLKNPARPAPSNCFAQPFSLSHTYLGPTRSAHLIRPPLQHRRTTS